MNTTIWQCDRKIYKFKIQLYLGDIYSRVNAFIKQDPELKRKMLLYEPIWIQELQKNLKENGIKCNMSFLMDYLDQQCITFRTKQGKTTRGRRKMKSK